MRLRSSLKKLILAGLVGVVLAAAVFFFFGRQIFGYALPTEKLVFSSLKPKPLLEIKDRNGLVIGYFRGVPGRPILYRSLKTISPHLRDWVVLLEDAKFYSHEGFDFDEIKNSFLDNLEAGRILRGGSTLSQQLAKNMFLDEERTLVRKLFEIPWTLQIERDLSKNQILELYMNFIEWGPGVYGAEMASRHYFDKTAQELTPEEALFLALIIPNPIRFDPLQNPSRLKFLKARATYMIERWNFENKKSGIKLETQQDFSLSWNFADPSENNRRFLPFHIGNYGGQKVQRQKILAPFEEHIEKYYWASVKRNGDFRLAIIWPTQFDFFNWKLVKDPSEQARRFCGLKSNESPKFVAIRSIGRNQSLQIPDSDVLDTQGLALVCQEKIRAEDLFWDQ